MMLLANFSRPALRAVLIALAVGMLSGNVRGQQADFVVIGAKVYFSDVTGKADDQNSASTVSRAVYSSGVLSGINEAGETVYAALVDMQGGL